MTSPTQRAGADVRRSTHHVHRGEESIPCYCALTMDHSIGREASDDALALAIRFHETYERLAPSFGYETRTETRAFDPTTPNGRLMVAVCGELLAALPERAPVSAGDEYHGVAAAVVMHACERILGRTSNLYRMIVSEVGELADAPPAALVETRLPEGVTAMACPTCGEHIQYREEATPAPPVGADWVVELRKVLEIAPNASTSSPMKWAAHRDMTPEKSVELLAHVVNRTVEDGYFSGEMHLIEDSGTGHAIAYTGCGLKSGHNAQFLVACAHFILRFGESLAAAPTPAEARGVGDGWQRKVFDALRTFAENDDPEGCAIGRPMFDALTALGLLRKVGRNLWEMTDAGEAALAANKPDTRQAQAQGSEQWRAQAEEMLRRLETMQPPNVVLQQLQILGEMAALLRCIYTANVGSGGSDNHAQAGEGSNG